MSNPFLTYPGIVERSRDIIHLCLRDKPITVGYQFWGHRSINDAYGDPTNSGVGGAGASALFAVHKGQAFRSPSLRRSGRGQVHGSIKGQTHAVFTGADYAVPGVGSSPVPPDEHWVYVRVQEERIGAGLLTMAGPLPVLGPICCVPPAVFFGTHNPSFTMQGTAPSSTASAAMSTPDLDEDLTSAAPRAMHLVFPSRLSKVHIRNISLVNLLVSFGPGQPMVNVAAGDSLNVTSHQTSIKEVLLACPDGVAGADFTFHGVAMTGA